MNDTRWVSTKKYYEVVKDWIDEVIELFKLRCFHIGMDEAPPMAKWQSDLDRGNQAALAARETYFVKTEKSKD